MTRSIPSISSSGKESPQSTTTILSSYSKAVMFIPICSRPPSGMILSFEDDLRLFFRPDGLPLFLTGLCVFLLLFFTAPPAAVFFTDGRNGLSWRFLPPRYCLVLDPAFFCLGTCLLAPPAELTVLLSAFLLSSLFSLFKNRSSIQNSRHPASAEKPHTRPEAHPHLQPSHRLPFLLRPQQSQRLPS